MTPNVHQATADQALKLAAGAVRDPSGVVRDPSWAFRLAGIHALLYIGDQLAELVKLQKEARP
jgi:hypothetical protein